ncbi:MAG: hypothetical protein KC550_07285, partial [Nanoarchaeota archaeon]|nr:hypothetical protein [Nanoarchaeota archaeon]
ANPSKIFIPIPAGIAKMNRTIYLIITYITSVIWAIFFTLIGYYFGKSYDNFGFIGVGLLLIFVVFASYFYKLMNSQDVIDELENKTKEKIVKENDSKKTDNKKDKNSKKTKKTNKNSETNKNIKINKTKKSNKKPTKK